MRISTDGIFPRHIIFNIHGIVFFQEEYKTIFLIRKIDGYYYKPVQQYISNFYVKWKCLNLREFLYKNNIYHSLEMLGMYLQIICICIEHISGLPAVTSRSRTSRVGVQRDPKSVLRFGA